MPFFEWKDEYSIGVIDIDLEHQRLVDQVNRLHDNMNVAGMRLFLEVFLDQLVQYTEYHFGNEERLMRQTDYPKLAEHLAAHQGLKTQVTNFREQFVRNEADISEDLMKFLREWLVNHIGGMDREAGRYFISKGIT